MNRLFPTVAVVAALFLLAGCTSSGDKGGGGKGSTNSQFQGECSLRVSGGAQCTTKKGPIALITLTRNSTPIAICTGTFLTQSAVLTAGHCFAESGANGAIVWADGEQTTAASYEVHPRYSLTTASGLAPYDVAVIKLKDSLNVSTLPLLLGELPSSGELVNVIGYGLDENGHSAADQSSSESLRKGVMTYRDIEENVIILEPGAGGQTICPGDSGSPGIYLNHDDIAGVVGVASLALGQNISDLEQCHGVQFAAFSNVQLGLVTDFILEQVPDADAI